MAIATIAAIAAIAGAGSQIYSASQANNNSPQYGYTPQYSSTADWYWNYLNNNTALQAADVYPTVSPTLRQALATATSAPFQGLTQAGQQAAGYYPGLAAQAGQYGDLLKALGLGAASGGAQVMNTAFDPQQQLYDRTTQQLQDQVRAANTAAGVATSPYGAGLEGQAMSNFNIDWQNQQLSRQAQGLMSYLQGNQLAGADITSSMGMYGQQPTNILQGGQLPVATQQQIADYLNQAAGNYSTGIGQAIAPQAGVQSQIIPYLYAGQGAGQNAFSQYALNQAFNTNQMTGGVSGLGQALNQFSQTPAGQSTNNWLGSLFGTQQPSMANYYGSGSVSSVPYGGY